MAFENFPYTDFHALNLDWILKKLKEHGVTIEDIKKTIEAANIPEVVRAALLDMVEDGTLAQIINEELLGEINNKVDENTNSIQDLETNIGNMTVAFLAKPDNATEDPDRGYSLCVVLHNDKVCITYDLGNDSGAERLLSYLSTNGISKVDAAIISHYHNDHATSERVAAVLNSGIPVTRWYLPHHGIDWNAYTGTGYAAVENNIKSLITGAGGAWTEPDYEGYPLTMDGVELKFYNVSPSLYADYYGYQWDEDMEPIDHSNYNNFSMVCTVESGGCMCALTGDIEAPAQEHMAPVVRGADIMLIPHHGLNLYESETFWRSVTAKISVASAYGVARFRRLTNVASPLAYHCGNVGAALSTVNGQTVICNMGSSGVFTVPANAGTTIPNCTYGQKIRRGTDFNSLNRVGFYGFVQNADEAASMSNMPFASGGRLWVIPGNQNSQPNGSLVQIYMASFSWAHPDVAIRMMDDGEWKPWKHVAATSIT